MSTIEALELGITGRTRWRQAHVAWLLVAISTALAGPVVGSPSETSPQPIKGGDLVNNLCMELHAGSMGKMLPILCQVMADECKQNPGGDGCKGSLAKLDEKMKPKGTSMLFAAAHAGRPDIVKTMLDTGSDPNATVATGWTPLLIATAEGHEGVVAALLEGGAAPSVKNELGRTALMFASDKAFTNIVRNLLARGADPNIAPTDEHGWTALMVAARRGHLETVQALLAGGADATLRDKSGNTALALADAQGHSEVARVLTEHGQKKQ